MQFTYEWYIYMLRSLIQKGYKFKNYKNWEEREKTVILRHDIDYSLQKAAALSEIEKDFRSGIQATYFVLVSTNFYNIHSKDSREYMEKIQKNGGIIGLHFDEAQYAISSENEMKDLINQEIDILSNVIESKVDVISMHRISQKTLSANIEFTNIINSYSALYFKRMKYLSDSRRYWREDIDGIINAGKYPQLHILTHPFWYEECEKNLKQTLLDAMLSASLSYYDNMNNNFRDLEHEVERMEIEKIIKS